MLGVTSDLLICGLGPAGRALAHRASVRELTVTVVDPAPARRWTATYAAWADEVPAWISPEAVAAVVARPIAWGTRRFEIERAYTVFDTAALQDSLDLGAAGVVRDRVEQILRPRSPRTLQSVRLSGGEVITARRVIDARGVGRSPRYAEQTAYGVVLHRDRWDEPLFMDWRRDNGTALGEPPSFLYAIPLSADTVLLEETCLAGRPALDPGSLRDRLHTRMRCRGIEFDGTEPVERVRFALQGGRPGAGRFGAAGGLLHPATGYSVAAALSAADDVVAGGSTGSVAARTVHLAREAGLRALLALPPADLPIFFDAFFELPISTQRAYLSGRDDLPGTAAAMTSLFRALPWRLRRTLATAVLAR
jgi:lycopene beta-cyclase